MQSGSDSNGPGLHPGYNQSDVLPRGRGFSRDEPGYEL